MPALHTSPKDGGLSFKVKVVPRASRDKIAGLLDGALKVMLTAPPVEGAANQALVKLLSKTLGIAKSEVVITAGHTARLKTVWVAGLVESELAKRLGL